MKLIYLIVFVAVIGLLWLANGVRRIGAVSEGPVITERAETALLMIDLQTVFWDGDDYADAEKLAAKEAIQAEIEEAQKNGHKIIAVRHEWSLPATKVLAKLTMGGKAIAGTPGTEVAEPFSNVSDHTLVKRVQDAFEMGELDALLAELNVGKLRIVGLDYNYCVLKTALAARNRGFGVYLNTAATLSSASHEKAEASLVKAGVLIQ